MHRYARTSFSSNLVEPCQVFRKVFGVLEERREVPSVVRLNQLFVNGLAVVGITGPFKFPLMIRSTFGIIGGHAAIHL